jgi:tRNA-intron endonuclease
MITAHSVSGQLQSNSREAFALFEKSCFGERDGDVVVYMPVEVLFLMKQRKLVMEKSGKPVPYEKAFASLKRMDPKISVRLPVFSDLRKKGFMLKTGLKFGGDFRVYDKGSRPGTAHAKWILVCQKDSSKIDWSEFSSRNRVAHSTNKRVLLALVDQENNPNYYEISWMRL